MGGRRSWRAGKILGGARKDRRPQEMGQGHGTLRGVRLGALGGFPRRLKPNLTGRRRDSTEIAPLPSRPPDGHCGTTPSRPTLRRGASLAPSAFLTALSAVTWTPGLSSLRSPPS